VSTSGERQSSDEQCRTPVEETEQLWAVLNNTVDHIEQLYEEHVLDAQCVNDLFELSEHIVHKRTERSITLLMMFRYNLYRLLYMLLLFRSSSITPWTPETNNKNWLQQMLQFATHYLLDCNMSTVRMLTNKQCKEEHKYLRIFAYQQWIRYESSSTNIDMIMEL
jgi:hypothetical protein